ncbi:uncharacterized protein FPRO_12607 [Fusarium proliferatum ET1]|uniref:Uncharacterized protein n=1 Tax=Fusarium proliferatum (strain ET1) TaxID=1227346 RepID=A0A1L7W5V5_FUSPR|nr:uncharacterized protein FPRO_12607 [Fusarium proliferatum ET1]CZR47997.1 uncharacterized protein FPRO_12607 [Fusarium proliferatum ET1]
MSPNLVVAFATTTSLTQVQSATCLRRGATTRGSPSSVSAKLPPSNHFADQRVVRRGSPSKPKPADSGSTPGVSTSAAPFAATWHGGHRRR